MAALQQSNEAWNKLARAFEADVPQQPEMLKGAPPPSIELLSMSGGMHHIIFCINPNLLGNSLPKHTHSFLPFFVTEPSQQPGLPEPPLACYRWRAA